MRMIYKNMLINFSIGAYQRDQTFRKKQIFKNRRSLDKTDYGLYWELLVVFHGWYMITEMPQANRGHVTCIYKPSHEKANIMYSA